MAPHLGAIYCEESVMEWDKETVGKLSIREMLDVMDGIIKDFGIHSQVNRALYFLGEDCTEDQEFQIKHLFITAAQSTVIY